MRPRRRRRWPRRASIALVVASLVSLGAAHGDEQISVEVLMESLGDVQMRLIEAQLKEAVLHDADFRLARAPSLGELADNKVTRLEVELEEMVPHTVLAVCDQGCGDVDLVVSNDRGEVVAVDTSYDTTPRVVVMPTRSGTFSVKIIMADCDTARCSYGVAVLRAAASSAD